MISSRLRNIFLISILGCLESMASLQGHSPDSLPALQAFTAAPSAVCLSKPSAPERHPNLLVLLMLAASSPCQLSRPPSSLPSRGQSVLGPPGGWKWPCPVPHPCTHQFPRMSPWAPLSWLTLKFPAWDSIWCKLFMDCFIHSTNFY